MGLDITAFSKVEFCDIQNESAFVKYQNCTILTPSDVVFNQSCGMEEGYYIYNGEHHSFRVGPYSSYNIWRNGLSKLIGFNSYQDFLKSIDTLLKRNNTLSNILDEKINIETPFVELLYFSDCEGFIGKDISKKLYSDFEKYEKDAISMSNDMLSKDWLELYLDFKKGFLLASDNGVLKFQ
jgi:hypothetical protein